MMDNWDPKVRAGGHLRLSWLSQHYGTLTHTFNVLRIKARVFKALSPDQILFLKHG